jgi:hypothetical protein
MSRRSTYRRILFVSAALAVVVAVVIIAGVMPSVRADVYPGARPEKAIPAFWANVAISLLVAAVLMGLALASERRGRCRRVVTGLAGLTILLCGVALLDAGAAFGHHGPTLSLVSTVLFVCGPAQGLAGLLALIATFLPARARTEPG